VSGNDAESGAGPLVGRIIQTILFYDVSERQIVSHELSFDLSKRSDRDC
jgi:hypothetical protein